MIKTASAALALAFALAAGSFATLPQPASAAPIVKAALPDHQPDGATFSWRGENLKQWAGTHFFGIMPDGNAGQSYTAPAGSLAIRMEYPGVIESVSVKDGPWKVESTDLNSFTLTNAQPITVSFGVSHSTQAPTSNVQVSGKFDRNFVAGSLVRGSGVRAWSNARVS